MTSSRRHNLKVNLGLFSLYLLNSCVFGCMYHLFTVCSRVWSWL